MANHGTYTEYRRGCRCYPCRVAASTYTAQRRALNEQGITAYVPVTLAQKALRKHLDAGITLVDVARATGFTAVGLRHIRDGGCVRVKRTTYDRLRVAIDPAAATAVRKQHPVQGSLARVRILGADGWPQPLLRTEHGVTVRHDAHYVYVAQLERIIELTQTLGPGPSQISTERALKAGYRPRAEYDRDTLLNPSWDGTGGLLRDEEPAGAHQLGKEFIHLVRHGTPVDIAAEKVGRAGNRKWIAEFLRRHNLTHLYE